MPFEFETQMKDSTYPLRHMILSQFLTELSAQGWEPISWHWEWYDSDSDTGLNAGFWSVLCRRKAD
jgi:hypothetical protein